MNNTHHQMVDLSDAEKKLVVEKKLGDKKGAPHGRAHFVEKVDPALSRSVLFVATHLILSRGFACQRRQTRSDWSARRCG